VLHLHCRHIFFLFVTMVFSPSVSGHGSYHAKLDELDGRIAESPDDAALYVQRADLHLSHDDGWRAALIDLERADRLTHAPELTQGLRGRALKLGGHWRQARVCLEEHLLHHPEDQPARFDLGQCRFEMGESNEGLGLMSQSLRAWPAANVNVVRDYVEIVQRVHGPLAAHSELIEHFKTRSDFSDVSMLALTLAKEARLWDDALVHADAVSKLAPRPEPWMAERARLYGLAERQEDAVKAWTGLHEHLLKLPSLERGTPLLALLLVECRKALGLAEPPPVIAPPAPQ
jgi:tetratricopeptide (TPR) repeat protein